MKNPAPYHKLRVLIADDDEEDHQMLCEAIADAKVEIALNNVNNGEKLMEYLSQCNGNAPDLIFLDLSMPKKNGMECLAEIRTDAKFKDTMIAVYSTSSVEKDINNTFYAGANIYITKPNDHLALIKIVEDVLSINWQYHTSGMSKKNFVMVR